MMPIDYTVERINPGDLIKVEGKLTETTGKFVAIGLNEDHEPRILLEVATAPILFAYNFGEIVSIEMVERCASTKDPAEDEVDQVEGSYEEDVLNANAGGHGGSAVKSRFGAP
jgi:hypothetical protein